MNIFTNEWEGYDECSLLKHNHTEHPQCAAALIVHRHSVLKGLLCHTVEK